MAGRSLAVTHLDVSTQDALAESQGFVVVRTPQPDTAGFRALCSGLADRTLGSVAYGATSLLCVLFELGDPGPHAPAAQAHPTRH